MDREVDVQRGLLLLLLADRAAGRRQLMGARKARRVEI